MANGNGFNSYSQAEAANALIGQQGFERIDDTSAHTTGYMAIKAINGNAVIADSVVNSGQALESGDRILEGDIIYGDFASITLTSGVVLAYIG